MAVKSETELYEPVKKLLEQMGYTVRSEVRHCDIVAYREEEPEPIIVELKKSFNLALVFQLLERQKLSERVYAAVEYDPKRKVSTGYSWNDCIRLCMRLGIGLIGVQFYKRKSPAVDILCRPEQETASARRSHVGLKRLKSEFDRRSGDYNTGGSTKQKVVTAYRERALRIARQLDAAGSMSPKELREALHDAGIYAILRRNVYGWFVNVSKGQYSVTEAGREALSEYAHIPPS